MTPAGYENLSAFVPSDIEAIEKRWPNRAVLTRRQDSGPTFRALYPAIGALGVSGLQALWGTRRLCDPA